MNGKRPRVDLPDDENAVVEGTVVGAAAVPSGTTDVVAVALDHGADRVKVGADGSVDVSRSSSKRVAPAVASDENVDKYTPSMTGRSHIEVTVTAHLLEALFGTSGATLETLWDALRRGDAFERSDSAFELAHGLIVMKEWDGGRWHTADPASIAKDIRKLNRQLAADKRAVIMRVRADGAPPLDNAIAAAIAEQVDRNRIIVVQLQEGKESTNPAIALRAIAKALVAKLDELGNQAEFADRLRIVANRPDPTANRTSKHAKDLVHETYVLADTAYKQALLVLEDVVGSPDAARQVLETVGVVTRLGAIVVGLKRLRDEFGVSIANLPTLLSDCVAAAIEKPGFWLGLERLRDEFNIPTTKFPTLLSGGVAAAIEKPGFWCGLERMRDEFDIPTSKFPTLLSNSVAAAIEKPGFWLGLERLRDEFDIPTSKFPTLLSDGVAAAIESTGFWLGLERLRDEFNIPTSKFPTLLSNSVAAAIEKPGFWTLVKWLLTNRNISVDKLASFANSNSFFSTNESIIHETLTMLTDEYGIYPDDLPTQNAFWSHVKKEGTLNELRAYLETCKTTGAVTMRIAKLNGAGIGRGATKCKFARPKLEIKKTALPKASKQASLSSFFKAPSVPSHGAGGSGDRSPATPQ